MLNKLVNTHEYAFYPFRMSLNDCHLKKKTNTVILLHNTGT